MTSTKTDRNRRSCFAVCELTPEEISELATLIVGREIQTWQCFENSNNKVRLTVFGFNTVKKLIENSHTITVWNKVVTGTLVKVELD